MFDRTLRIGTISLLVPGTLGALAGVAGAGPGWVPAASEAVVLFGFAGLVALHSQGRLESRQSIT